MKNALRIPFLVSGLYIIVVGLIQVFPTLAEKVFGRPITDPAIESIWGASLIGMALFNFLAATDAQKYKAFAWPLMAAFLLLILDGLFYWTQGSYTLGTILPLVVINFGMAIWLFVAQQQSKA